MNSDHNQRISLNILGFVLVVLLAVSCKSSPTGNNKKPGGGTPPDTSTTNPPSGGNDSNSLDPNIPDNYASVADFADHSQWGSFNVHDPSVIKVGDWYYMFTTDVAYGDNLDKIGIQRRKSKDLVHWAFDGWAFDNGIPPKELAFMQANQPGYQQEGIWAPYIMKVGDTFRLYYAVPGNNGLKLAAIGLATSTGILGPWKDNGIVIATTRTDPINSIDPSVIVDHKTGRYWMAYGSYSAGIFIVELNPATGMLLHPGDTGKRIAYREKDGDSIEGADILYNPDLDKYFLFVSYGWLEDTYNVRVGRADNPQGPYYDYNDKNMADIGDNLPRITAEYKFDNHPGWQGFGGNCTLKDGDRYYYISQARLASNKYFMDLHVHRMFWTPDGWPVISPERYDAVPQEDITKEDLEGKWEYIVLNSTTSLNTSIHIQLLADGTIAGGTANSIWSYDKGILKLDWNNGGTTVQAKVSDAWDWENSKLTIVFTGLNDKGISAWGKKIE